MKFIISVLCISGIMVLYGCKPAKETTESTINHEINPQPVKPEPQNIQTQTDKPSVQEANNSPENLSLIQGMSDFSFNFYKNLSADKKGSNLCFSPVSLNMAVAMVYSGSRNNTKTEISKTLNFNDSLSIFHKEFKAYYKNLNDLKNDPELDFNLANRIFIEKTFLILDSYREIIGNNYEGAFEQMDFLTKYFDSEKYINQWVEKMTKNRIKDLLPAGTLGSDTKMVLVNAIYIKSKWRYAFDEKETLKKDFKITASEIQQTDFMIKKQEGVRYYTDQNISAIELPYTSTGLSLIIIRPHNSNIDNISDYVPTGASYFNMLNSMQRREVHMEIPKFKIETSFSLSEPLIAIGMKDAFNSRADFSGITGSRDLEISQVLQKVFFEIDEKGTEAAAATAIVMRTTSSANYNEMDRTIYFIADQPFIFILKENSTNTPLFIGQYVKP